MAKASKLFLTAEFIYNVVVPKARGRKMISMVDTDHVPDAQKGDYASYRNAVVCFSGGFAVLLVLQTPPAFVAAAVLFAYGYMRAERFYAPLATTLAPFFPSALDPRTIEEKWADKHAGSGGLSFAPPAETMSGSGPWVAYAIDTNGIEKKLRRFETDGAAQTYADLQMVMSRGKITHAGVTYSPEK